MSRGTLTIRVVGDAGGWKRTVGGVETDLAKFQNKLRSIQQGLGQFGRFMTTRVTLPIAGAFAVGVRSLVENEKLLAQTAAVLKSTGGAAGVTAEQVRDLAFQYSNLSGVAHETILNAQNVLLTFTKVRNEVGAGNDIFNQATGAILNMSVALGQDMQQATIQVGKALQDPILGISALRRVGVQLGEQQEEMIRQFVEAGDVMSAQKIILAELETQFGGSAEAAGNTMGGALNRLKNLLQQVARTLAMPLLPALERIAAATTGLAERFEALSPQQQRFISITLLLVAALGPLALALKAVIGLVLILTSPIGLVVVALAALTAGFIYAYRNSETFRNIVDGVVKFLRDIALPAVLNFVNGFIQGFQLLWRIVKPIIDTIGAAIRGLTAAASTVGRVVGGAIGAVTGRQHGGPVWRGGAFVVGERGPELFVPNQGGRIVSNRDLAGTGPTVNNYITGLTPDEVERQTRRALRTEALRWRVS